MNQSPAGNTGKPPEDRASDHLKESSPSNASPSTSTTPVKEGDKEQVPQKHSINPLLTPTKSTRLTQGSRVIILGTDNVEQRVPQYVGLEAEIIVVPVHPATWFKVKFDNGKIATFRPSALRLLSDGTTVDPNYTPPPKKPKPTSRPRANSLKDKPGTSSSLHGNKCLLTSIHPDLWPNCTVRILSGRLTGHRANVLSSGNGWVQLQSSYGELAKRASELELLSRTNSSQSPPTDAPPLNLSIPKPGLTRRRSNSEPGSPTEISNRRNEFSTRNHTRKERKEMELQREYVQKYIDKQQAKIRTRPDLKYWLNRIQGSMVDPNFERNVCRDVRNNFCHSCFMEMWSGSKYCWNELCPMSPVYWKHVGAAGEPPFDRYDDAKMKSNMNPMCTQESSAQDSVYACEVLLSLKSDIRMDPIHEKKSKVEQPSKSSVSFAPATTVQKASIGEKRSFDEARAKRSDSGITDSEDTPEDVSSKKMKIEEEKKKMSPPQRSAVQLTPASPRKQGSPRTLTKRMMFQGAPPSQEEFAKFVMQHEKHQEQLLHEQRRVSPPRTASARLPGFSSAQLHGKTSSINSLTSTSPLLTSRLNPDYPTNKAIIASIKEHNRDRKSVV